MRLLFNRLYAGYGQPRSPRIFGNEAYLVNERKANELMGDENNKPEGSLIEDWFQIEDIMIAQTDPDAMKYFTEFDQKFIKECFKIQRNFKIFANQRSAIRREEILANDYIKLAIVENKREFDPDMIFLNEVRGRESVIEAGQKDKSIRFQNAVYSTVSCKGLVVMLYQFYDPAIHTLKKVMLMKNGLNTFAKLSHLKQRIRDEMKDMFPQTTDTDLFTNYESYCHEKNCLDKFNDANEEIMKIDRERSSYFMLFDMDVHWSRNQYSELYFKEVITRVQRKTWLTFGNTGLVNCCALFEYLWYYGAMPVNPLKDPAKIFFKDEEGNIFSSSSYMRDDGTLYLIGEIEEYELVNNGTQLRKVN